MTSFRQLKRFEARISLFKSLDCPLALAAAGWNQRFTRYPPVINHNLGWCNWTPRNKLQWNSNQNIKVFIHKNTFECVGCEMVAILSRGRWVNFYWSVWCMIYFLPLFNYYVHTKQTKHQSLVLQASVPKRTCPVDSLQRGPVIP